MTAAFTGRLSGFSVAEVAVATVILGFATVAALGLGEAAAREARTTQALDRLLWRSLAVADSLNYFGADGSGREEHLGAGIVWWSVTAGEGWVRSAPARAPGNPRPPETPDSAWIELPVVVAPPSQPQSR